MTIFSTPVEKLCVKNWDLFGKWMNFKVILCESWRFQLLNIKGIGGIFWTRRRG